MSQLRSLFLPFEKYLDPARTSILDNCEVLSPASKRWLCLPQVAFVSGGEIALPAMPANHTKP